MGGEAIGGVESQLDQIHGTFQQHVLLGSIHHSNPIRRQSSREIHDEIRQSHEGTNVCVVLNIE